jgi:hypothetical protein
MFWTGLLVGATSVGLASLVFIVFLLCRFNDRLWLEKMKAMTARTLLRDRDGRTAQEKSL